MSHQIRKGAVHFMKEKRAESGKKSERGRERGGRHGAVGCRQRCTTAEGLKAEEPPIC